MRRFHHDISQREKSDDKVMQLVILQQKIPKIGCSHLVRSVPHLHHSPQGAPRSSVPLFHQIHELPYIRLLSLHAEKLPQSLKTEELLLLLPKRAIDEEELERTAAVHALSLALQFGKRQLGVSQQAAQQLHILPHSRNALSQHGIHRPPIRILLHKEGRVLLGQRGHLRNFDSPILRFCEEGEVKRFIGAVDELREEAGVVQQRPEVVVEFQTGTALAQRLEVLPRQKRQHLRGRPPTARQSQRREQHLQREGTRHLLPINYKYYNSLILSHRELGPPRTRTPRWHTPQSES